jgi:hypothetical protein
LHIPIIRDIPGLLRNHQWCCHRVAHHSLAQMR